MWSQAGLQLAFKPVKKKSLLYQKFCEVLRKRSINWTDVYCLSPHFFLQHTILLTHHHLIHVQNNKIQSLVHARMLKKLWNQSTMSTWCPAFAHWFAVCLCERKTCSSTYIFHGFALCYATTWMESGCFRGKTGWFGIDSMSLKLGINKSLFGMNASLFYFTHHVFWYCTL